MHSMRSDRANKSNGAEGRDEMKTTLYNCTRSYVYTFKDIDFIYRPCARGNCIGNSTAWNFGRMGWKLMERIVTSSRLGLDEGDSQCLDEVVFWVTHTFPIIIFNAGSRRSIVVYLVFVVLLTKCCELICHWSATFGMECEGCWINASMNRSDWVRLYGCSFPGMIDVACCDHSKPTTERVSQCISLHDICFYCSALVINTSRDNLKKNV